MTKVLLLLLGVLAIGHTGAETMEEKRERLKQEEARKQTEAEQQRQLIEKKRATEATRLAREEQNRRREEQLQREAADRQARRAQAERERVVREQAAEAEQQAKIARERAEKERALGLEMVNIPAGSFEMGCTQPFIIFSPCNDNEKPVHKVQISAFQLGKTEVTQGQWKAVMGSNPSYFSSLGDSFPVEEVSWDDVQTFIQKLNAQTGKTYRLPSESEWEYACRAGRSHNYCGSDNEDAVAWYKSNSGNKTHPVGGKQANAWGLYDMSGNVYEWVQDSYHSDYKGAPSDSRAWEGASTDARVLRGGSWGDDPQYVRAAVRYSSTASVRGYGIGFRLARTLP